MSTKFKQLTTIRLALAVLMILAFEVAGLGQDKKGKEAIEIFKLNVEAYPQGFNTYDSLGEAHMRHGDKQLAITNTTRNPWS